MPRSLPAEFTALIGASSASLIYLLEWELSGGTQRYSSNRAVTYGGNNYAPRIKSIDGLASGMIDGEGRDFDEVSITLSNLADDSSTSFPITALDAAARFEDRVVRIHLLDTISGVALENIWWGYTKAPEYDGENKTVIISASFPWDSLDLPIPKVRAQRRCPYPFTNETGTGAESIGCPYTTFGTPGFTTCAKNPDDCSARGMSRFFGGWRQIGLLSGVQSKRDLRKERVPIVMGVDNFKIRPLIYLSRITEDNFLLLNFMISGVRAGQPFDASDLTASNVRLFDITNAAAIFFNRGEYPQALPTDLTLFPDGTKSGHSLVAHAAAAISITSQIKDKLDSLEHDDLKLKIVNGRKTALTGLPTENPVYQLLDILTDEVFGLGLPISNFDATSYAAAASYASTRYQSRLELHEEEPIADFVMRMLRDFHGYITFENAKVHIKCKRNDETSIATFGTGGRKIHKDIVAVTEKDSTELKNQAHITYRIKNRQEREVIIYDKLAQRRAGNGIEKVEEEEWESPGLYKDEQVDINGAIYIREQQNLNLFASFETPVCDSLDIVAGDIIRVNSPDIPNNGTNFLFRVKRITPPGPNADQITSIEGQIYKATVYQDTADPLGTDILRTEGDTSGIGRPPDVTPVSLTRIDTEVNDTAGKLASLRCVWTYPTVDVAAQQAEGIFAPYPIIEVALFVRYTDESINEARLAKTVKYPTATADVQIDFHKNRIAEVFFVAVGHNHARAPLGYQSDPTKTMVLTANLSATAITGNVDSSTPVAVNDFVRCENEFMKVTAKTATQLTFASSGGNRTPQLDSSAIAHPSGTQIAVAKQSYPSLTLSLTPPRFTYPVVAGLVGRQRNEGVRFGWTDPSADNEEKFLLYWSTDGDALSNAAKLGVNNPTWYLTDPNSPPAGVNLVKTDALSHKVLQEAIGAAGTTVAARVAARNGKHNYSSTLSASASNKLGDDAVTAVSTAPKVQAKKQGIKVRAILPTTNMQTFGQSGKVEHVIRAKNSGGTILGYLSDDTSGSFVSSGSEFKFDHAKSPGHFYNFNKEATQALWPTASKLEVYVYVSNAVGPSAASAIVDITVSTWEVGDVPQDSAAPTISAGPDFRYINGAFRVNQRKSTLSNVNNPTLVEITINNGTDSLNIGDLSAEVAASGIVFYDIGKTNFKDTIPIPKQQIRRIFALSDSLRAALKITNNAGTTTGPNSSLLSVSTLKDINPAQNPVQILRNAEMGFKDASGDLDIWQKYNAGTGGFSDVPIGSGDLRFEDLTAEVKWHQNSATDKRYLIQKLGNLFKREQPLALSYKVRTSGSLTFSFDGFIGTIFQATGTASINGTTTVTGDGSCLFLSELKAGDEITINSQTRIVQSIASDTSLTVTVAFSGSASGQNIFVVSPQTQLLTLSTTLNTAEAKVQGVVTYSATGDVTATPKYILYRVNGTINTGGPHLYFFEPTLAYGLTPIDIAKRPEFETGHGSGAGEDFDTEPTAATGGVGIEGSGSPPPPGGLEVLQT